MLYCHNTTVLQIGSFCKYARTLLSEKDFRGLQTRWCLYNPMPESLSAFSLSLPPHHSPSLDLFGLLAFIAFDPYCVEEWWKRWLWNPYCCGIKDPLHQVLAKVMWRNSMEEVKHQVSLLLLCVGGWGGGVRECVCVCVCLHFGCYYVCFHAYFMSLCVCVCVCVCVCCLLYTSPSPRDRHRSRMPSSA